jgi:type II pantothenate kinase
VEGEDISRVGGTALGGGTLLGLGQLLLGTRRFPEIAALAERGTRGRVDLLLSDVYPEGENPLARVVTASAFGRVAWRDAATAPSREDLACALMGLVGENVGLLARALARESGAQRVVLAGTTLRDESVLSRALLATLLAHGETPVVLERAAFAGALGALRLAEAAQ